MRTYSCLQCLKEGKFKSLLELKDANWLIMGLNISRQESYVFCDKCAEKRRIRLELELIKEPPAPPKVPSQYAHLIDKK